MSKFKVGDSVIVTNTKANIAGNSNFPADTSIKAVVNSVSDGSRLVLLVFAKDKNLHGHIFGEAARLVSETKIQVGSTYLTPTGLKRKIVWADERGALASDENDVRRYYNHKMTGGWIEVPPEVWVNIQQHGAPRLYTTSSKLFSSEAEAKADLISGEASGAFYVRSVRVDEAWRSAS